MFTIEKGVPFKDGRAHGRNRKYPWHELEVGDSFLVQDVSRVAMDMTGRYHTSRTGKTFKAAKDGDGVRVWRIS